MEGITNSNKVYHPRIPQDSPLWKMLNDHYDSFEQGYDERLGRIAYLGENRHRNVPIPLQCQRIVIIFISQIKSADAPIIQEA